MEVSFELRHLFKHGQNNNPNRLPVFIVATPIAQKMEEGKEVVAKGFCRELARKNVRSDRVFLELSEASS